MASDKAHSFIATGHREDDTLPKFTGFNTKQGSGRLFEYGANVLGAKCGVLGSTDPACREVPRNAGPTVAVCGVSPDIGVHGEATAQAGIGVHGVALRSSTQTSVGVWGQGTVGVRGEGGLIGDGFGPGAEFRSKRGAQIHLVPSEGRGGRPPRKGVAGDLLVIDGPKEIARLWLCIRGQRGTRPACWIRLAFDATFGPCEGL
jgi:hypothetical protein